MESKPTMTRRDFLKKTGWVVKSLIAAPFVGFGYARFMEPRFIQVVNRELELERLPASLNRIRIVQFSDVHLDFHFGLERMKDVISKIRRLQPDLICFTGDLYHESAESTGEACSQLLSRLEAPLGKWAVLGNHDYTADSASVTRVLQDGGFKVMMNERAAVKHNGASLQIVGIDDIFNGTADYERAFHGADPALFTLALVHEPDLADQTLEYPADLQLSGHSHGGQVRVPFMGPLILPEFAQKYPDGLYTLGNGKLLLYTNRGIGVSSYPIRFLCPPEITVLTLKKRSVSG